MAATTASTQTGFSLNYPNKGAASTTSTASTVLDKEAGQNMLSIIQASVNGAPSADIKGYQKRVMVAMLALWSRVAPKMRGDRGGAGRLIDTMRQLTITTDCLSPSALADAVRRYYERSLAAPTTADYKMVAYVSIVALTLARGNDAKAGFSAFVASYDEVKAWIAGRKTIRRADYDGADVSATAMPALHAMVNTLRAWFDGAAAAIVEAQSDDEEFESEDYETDEEDVIPEPTVAPAAPSKGLGLFSFMSRTNPTEPSRVARVLVPAAEEKTKSTRCGATTKAGTQCKRTATKGATVCSMHK